MQDRFKFKAVLHQNKYEEYQLEEFSHQRIFDVMSINLGIEYSTIEIIAEYPNGDWAVREIDEEDIDLIQCTGLKDKNGKLIYEGDVVKNNQNSLYSVEFEEFGHQTKFCLKRIEKPDYYPHISTWQGIGYKDQKNYEVVGNIYENKELLED